MAVASSNVTTNNDSRGPHRNRTWRKLLRHPTGTPSLVVIAVVVAMSVFAPWLSPYDPSYQDYSVVLQPPSSGHWFGTDEFGRDVLSRIIYGTRVSMYVGLLSVGLATLVGALVGLVSGFRGGLLDNVAMRTMDALYAFPALLLALAITGVLGPGINNLVIAIAVVYTPIFARLVRGSVLSIRTRDFVTASISLGSREWRVLSRHVFPNVTAPIIVQASLSVSFAVIAEASLSFLGVGVQPPTASWGSMLRTGYGYMEIAPWLAIFPGLAIFVTVLALNVLGDALRDVLDPRLKGR